MVESILVIIGMFSVAYVTLKFIKMIITEVVEFIVHDDIDRMNEFLQQEDKENEKM